MEASNHRPYLCRNICLSWRFSLSLTVSSKYVVTYSRLMTTRNDIHSAFNFYNVTYFQVKNYSVGNNACCHSSYAAQSAFTQELSVWTQYIKSRWNALEGSKTALYRWRGFSSKLTSSLCKSMFHYNVSQREQLKSQMHLYRMLLCIIWIYSHLIE